jgi:hypothetical protein
MKVVACEGIEGTRCSILLNMIWGRHGGTTGTKGDLTKKGSIPFFTK